jgi:hypothetical protein
LIIGFSLLGFLSDWVNLAVISFAMGTMNTALSKVGARSKVGAQLSLTFVNGTLSRIGMQLALVVRRTPPGKSGSVGYACAQGSPAGGHLRGVPRRRIVVGGGNTGLRRVGLVVPDSGPVGAGGCRSFFEHTAAIV